MVYELTMSLKSAKESSNTSPTQKANRTRRSRRKPVNFEPTNLYNEMFTTDPARIQEFIDSSEYADMIDPRVILKINLKVQELSEEDFMNDPDIMDEYETDMLLRFQNIMDRDPNITRILRKKRPTEEEHLALCRWYATNHASYCDENKPPREPYNFENPPYMYPMEPPPPPPFYS